MGAMDRRMEAAQVLAHKWNIWPADAWRMAEALEGAGLIDNSKTCECGHKDVDHHGTDPDEGCLGVISHKLPPCPCVRTCDQVGAA